MMEFENWYASLTTAGSLEKWVRGRTVMLRGRRTPVLLVRVIILSPSKNRTTRGELEIITFREKKKGIFNLKN
jgi:hypothetical protein